MVQNKGLIFKSVPTGWPVEGRDLAIEDRGFDPGSEPPKDGIITKNFYVSFDPYQRGRMRGPDVKSYASPFELGVSGPSMSSRVSTNVGVLKHAQRRVTSSISLYKDRLSSRDLLNLHSF